MLLEQARMGRWRDALEMLGEANPFKTSGIDASIVGVLGLLNKSQREERS
jgi:hypothetical protein